MALSIYADQDDYLNEIARTTYMLGLTYLEMEEMQKGAEEVKRAEDLTKKILGDDWVAPNGEESYDELVNFWSR